MMHSTATTSLNYNFQLAPAREAVRFALTNSCTPVLTTKFNEDSAVLLHLVSQIDAGVPVIWMDTGYNSTETIAFVSDISIRLKINLHIYQPENHTIRMPPSLDDPEHIEFVQQVKLEPFQRAFSTLQADVWLSSIRRYQSDYRGTLPVFDSLADGMLKVSPLLDWSTKSIARYRVENDLPLGPLCFDPTKGEPFRECGLHLERAG